MANILYLHGFASGPKPNSPKVALLRGLGHQVQCLSTEGRYRPADYLNAFHQLTKQAPLPDLLVGTSLGGFWARHFGCRRERPWIALNPALHPSQTLSQNTGTLQRFDVEASFEWSLENANDYLVFEDQWLNSEVPGLILCAKDDEVVDPQDTWRFSGKSKYVKLPRGGHELANTEDYADILARFINKALGER
ncbi:YqiA/YcfP family alpha/beta fold hydrolase [Halochromatium roseum]|uniref:YqiA/YcfP family alpha/beta fold hydrolase n=1 Tax=Halochromatium roseum TaxID=391920 RepID=UPI00191450E8|nr:YqiA/YcfP family alpha/beta fold hydrolase [Halochromatium roseum]MBK5940792.1 hypothetical protein [Halochromatium roseum]